MIIIGFVIVGIAVAAAIVLIAQNQSAMVQVHGLGYTGDVHVYWVMVAGLVIAAVGLLGLAMMRAGAVHTWRTRTERRGLVRENARLSELATDHAEAPAHAAASRVAAAPAVTTSRTDPAMVERSAVYDPGAAEPVPVEQHHRGFFHRRARQA